MNENLENIENDLHAANLSDLSQKYLTFWMDGQLLGVPISYVEQIIGMQEITEIPDYPPYAKGVINLRGSVIPVIDVRLRLGRAQKAYDDKNCIIVTVMNNTAAGFIVDGVEEVAYIPGEDISEPPKINDSLTDTCLTGVARQESRLVLLVDTVKLFTDDMMLQITNR